MARRGIVAERGHNVVAMRLERVRSAAAAGRKLRDRVALIEILPILRKAAEEQTWLTPKNAVPVRLNQLGQDDVNNCLACVAHLAQSQ